MQRVFQTLRASTILIRPEKGAHTFFSRYRQPRLVLGACGVEAVLPQALDPIPQGTEILMSYFPISLPHAERQQRLLSDYGFSCKCVSPSSAQPASHLLIHSVPLQSCKRCEIEGQGLAGMAVSDDDSASGDSSVSGEDWEQGGDGYSVEYSLWMLKFLCPKEGCGGTLAPPTTTAVVMEARHPARRCTFA